MIKDINFLKSKALPAAAATAYTDSLNLGSVIPGPIGSPLLIRISVPATPSLVDTKTITFNLQHSADDSTFVNVPTTGNMVVTAGGSGGAKKEFDFYLPPGIKQYIRASAAVETGGGSNVAVSFELAGLIG
jgi:hypothetical protein